MESNYEIEDEQVVSYVGVEKDHYTIHGNVVIKFNGKEHEIPFEQTYNKTKGR